MLSKNELAQYGNWIGKSPADILLYVNLNGGWASVFPFEIPKEVHIARNYFNEYPKEFSKCTKDEATKLVDKLERKGFKSNLALTGDMPFSDHTVYKDRASRVWFQMAPVAGAYHKGDGKPDNIDKAMGVFSSQSDVPYKLVSPDGTGGSSEIILLNADEAKSLSSKPGTWFSVGARHDLNASTAGSYNYSETVIMGYDAHKLRDMQPHEKHGGDYKRVDIFSPLQARTFS